MSELDRSMRAFDREFDYFQCPCGASGFTEKGTAMRCSFCCREQSEMRRLRYVSGQASPWLARTFPFLWWSLTAGRRFAAFYVCLILVVLAMPWLYTVIPFDALCLIGLGVVLAVAVAGRIRP